MKQTLIFAAAALAVVSPAVAGTPGTPNVVPEMSAGAGIAAIAFLAGAAAIIRERIKKK